MKSTVRRLWLLSVGALLAQADLAEAEFINNGFGLTSPGQVITFDSPVLSFHQSVTTEYPGVAFTGAFYDGDIVAPADPIPTFVHVTGHRLANFLAGIPFASFSVHFNTPQNRAAFAITTWPVKSDGSPAMTTFTARLGGVFVEAGTAPTSQSNPNDYFGFEGILFDEIQISVNSLDHSMLFDNLQTGAPAPLHFINNGFGLTSPGQVITFDSPVLSFHQSVTTEYPGVAFTGAFYDGDIVAPADPIPTFVHVTGHRLANFLAGIPFASFSVHFNTPQNRAAFAITTWPVKSDGSPAMTTFTARLGGVFVEAGTAPTSQSNPNDYFGFEGILFDEIRVSVNSLDHTLILDNIQTGLDQTPPVVSAPPDVERRTGAGATTCQIFISDADLGTATAIDDVEGGVPVIRSGVPAGNLFPVGVTALTYSATDAIGNVASAFQTITVVDDTPPIIAAPPYSVLTDPGTCTAVLSFAPMVQDNCGVSQVACTPPSGSTFPIGNTEVLCTAIDDAGNSASASFTVTVQNPAPIVSLTSPEAGAVFAVNTPVSFAGSFTDNPGDVHTAEWTFDLVPALEPTTVDEANGTVSLIHTFTAAGVYKVTMTVRDQCGNAGTAEQIGEFEALVVVYDPAAGSVAGGGWVQSPPGAYLPNPTLSGKGHFAFVSRYQNGATIPTGRTQFRFSVYSVANLDFKSESYEWLVVAGARAQYKGSGTLKNQTGDYGFLLTAIDGSQNGGGGVDKFRMKIWDRSTDALVYDSELGADDFGSPTLPLGGGDIKIERHGPTKAGGHETVGPETRPIPSQYALHGNYPDPFNPATTIQFDLPEQAEVSLTVYDIRGKVVARLADRETYPAGSHRVQFEARHLSSGVYFYRLRTAAYQGTKKMVLMK